MAQIKLKCIEAGETKVSNKWHGDIFVDGSRVNEDLSITFNAVVGQEVVVTAVNETVWTNWNSKPSPLVSGGKWECIEMPSMETFCKTPGVAGDGFFSYFNYGGSLTSLPEGSFDTSGITEAGEVFLAEFNDDGSITSLPEGSFNLSGVTMAYENFLSSAFMNSPITTLPRSFALPENLSSCPDRFMRDCFFALHPGDEVTGVPLYFACDSEVPVFLVEEMKPSLVSMIEGIVEALGDASEEEIQAAIDEAVRQEFYPGFVFDPDEPYLSIEGYLENELIVSAGTVLYVEANPGPVEPSSDKLLSGSGLKTFWREFVPKPATALPQPVGEAKLGTSTKYAREDHSHLGSDDGWTWIDGEGRVPAYYTTDINGNNLVIEDDALYEAEISLNNKVEKVSFVCNHELSFFVSIMEDLNFLGFTLSVENNNLSLEFSNPATSVDIYVDYIKFKKTPLVFEDPN